mgnify:CR=1 FL=1|tara:strand:+ start:2717 stop:3514 length:798 start_codon:yes stop_codon:yes gene_type:complete
MTQPDSRLAQILVLLSLTLSGCAAGPEPLTWRPEVRAPPLSIASLRSQVLATVELRLLRVTPAQADAWTSADRSALRVALVPDLRLRQVLAATGGTQSRTAYAPRVTVLLGQEARLGVQDQHPYIRDYALGDPGADGLPELRPVLGGFETGLRCRIRVDLEEDTGWDASLRTWVKLSGELRISELVELEQLRIEHPDLVGNLEIPKLELRRHALDLEVQPDQVTLLAPTMGPQSEDQILVLISVNLSVASPDRLGDSTEPAPKRE